MNTDKNLNNEITNEEKQDSFTMLWKIISGLGLGLAVVGLGWLMFAAYQNGSWKMVK